MYSLIKLFESYKFQDDMIAIMPWRVEMRRNLGATYEAVKNLGETCLKLPDNSTIRSKFSLYDLTIISTKSLFFMILASVFNGVKSCLIGVHPP